MIKLSFQYLNLLSLKPETGGHRSLKIGKVLASCLFCSIRLGDHNVLSSSSQCIFKVKGYIPWKDGRSRILQLRKDHKGLNSFNLEHTTF